MGTGFDTYLLGAIVLLTVCSILTRCTYLLFGDRFPLSESVRSALRFAPVAALAAIVVPELFPLEGGSAVVFNPRALAALAAVLMFWRTRSTLSVILGGMVAFWLIDGLLGMVA
ncbi:MAG: AzlD domain-containing protein [Castellaniella sp.]